MSKLSDLGYIQNPGIREVGGGLLDKLAQLGQNRGKSFDNEVNIRNPKAGKSVASLRKRARSKWMSNRIARELMKVDSPLFKSYRNTLYCNCELHQNGQKITAKYCGNRWCIVCGHLRTGKLMNGYHQVLQKLPEKHFVTLTRPNVTADKLQAEIEELQRIFSNIQKDMRRGKTPIIGIRKMECTYNPGSHTFHPHFHVLLSGEKEANKLRQLWLKRNPTARFEAQDVRRADDKSAKELFKYFTKLLTGKDKKLYPSAMDVIFRAMRGKRVFQPMGIKKVSEDIDELQAEEYTDIEPGTIVWTWEGSDWMDHLTGELLTGYTPSEVLQRIFDG